MTCRHILIFFAFVLAGCLPGCKPENPDKRTDATTKLAFRYLNEQKFDSLYQLTNAAYKQRMPRNMFIGYSEKLMKLGPFNSMDFLTGNDSVSFYKITGKMVLNCYVSLDKQGKMSNYVITPYQGDVKAATVKADDQKVDAFAHKVITMLTHKQVNDIYLLASDDVKSKISPMQWQNNIDGILEYAPLPPAVFLHSENGVNTYAMGIFRFVFGGINKEGKFGTFYFYLYHEEAEKALKVSNDNLMRSRLDSTVDKVLSPYIQKQENVGISAAVLYKGKTYFYNYGERKKGGKNLPDEHTLYDIGSITKTFTGTLFAIAINEKRLTLETPITKYLPDSVANNPDLKDITFKQLANHTAGLPREGANYKKFVTNVDQPYENYDTRDMFAFLENFKKTRQPGVKYSYSNLGFGLLGVLLETIYNKTYRELVGEYITGPLKMNETVFAIDTLRQKDWAQGYGMLSDPVPYFKLTSISAAGEIKSSTYDLMTYAQAQLSTPNGVLQAANQLTHQITFQGTSVTGLGWEYLPGELSVLQHGGATGGYRAAIGIDLNKKIAIVVLTNNANNGDQVGWRLIKELQGMK